MSWNETSLETLGYLRPQFLLNVLSSNAPKYNASQQLIIGLRKMPVRLKQGRDMPRFRNRFFFNECQVDADPEPLVALRLADSMVESSSTSHDGCAGYDAMLMGRDDSVGDSFGKPEIIRVHEQLLHRPIEDLDAACLSHYLGFAPATFNAQFTANDIERSFLDFL